MSATKTLKMSDTNKKKPFRYNVHCLENTIKLFLWFMTL